MERLSVEEKSPACDRATVDEALKVICTDTTSCVLMPKTFFVAWCGVLTLAFTGFPHPLQNMKTRFSTAIFCLPAENTGSRWPKTTIGCLSENQPPLSFYEFSALMDLCERYSKRFQLGILTDLPKINFESTACISNSSRNTAVWSRTSNYNDQDTSELLDYYSECWVVPVTTVSRVRYSSRSLETILDRIDFALSDELASNVSLSTLMAVDTTYTDIVLAEFGDTVTSRMAYFQQVQRSGNRSLHYRSELPVSGETLVIWLRAQRLIHSELPNSNTDPLFKLVPMNNAVSNTGTPSILADFRNAVEQLLPGRYEFFADNSLHITLRGL